MRKSPLIAPFVGFLLLFVSLSHNASSQDKILLDDSYGAEKDVIPELQSVESRDGRLILEYSFPGFYHNSVGPDTLSYDLFSIPGFSNGGEPAYPSLPVHTEILALGADTSPVITVDVLESHSMHDVFLFPAQYPASDCCGDDDPPFVINEDVYKTNSFFPASRAEIYKIQKMRGLPLAYLRISPFIYNPVKKEAQLAVRMRITIDYDAGSINVPDQWGNHDLSLLKNVVINSSALPEEALNIRSTDSLDYIILTTDEFLTAAHNLSVWKQHMGLITKVISKSSWTSAAVKDSIHEAYFSCTPHPDYFVIIGDHDDVPGEAVDSHYTDLYYACMDGSGDYVPDMGHGRISVSTAAEAVSVVDKIINYERQPPEDSWFYRRGINCAQFQDDEPDGYANRRFAHTAEEIRDYMFLQDYWVKRIYHAESNVSPTNWNNGYFSDGQAIPSELLKPSFAWDGDANDIISAVDEGAFYLFHRDHGYTGGSGWHRPYFTTTQIDGLNNGSLTPVVFSINCHTGEFSIDECFAEKFLRYQSGGAVGVVAASSASYSGFNDALVSGMFDAIWPDPGLISDFGSGGVSNPVLSPHGQILAMGDVMNQGLLRMEETWNGSHSYYVYQYELYHYFGDPAMKIRTLPPSSLLAEHDNTILTTASGFHVFSASSSGVTASLLINDTLKSRMLIDQEGGVLAFSHNLKLNDVVELCLTKENTIPYIATIIVTSQKPDAGFYASALNAYIGDEVYLYDTSLYGVDSLQWDVNPSSYTWPEGSDSVSASTALSFDSQGSYDVQLTAVNSFGDDVALKQSYINVLSGPNIKPQDDSLSFVVQTGDTASYNLLISNAGDQVLNASISIDDNPRSLRTVPGSKEGYESAAATKDNQASCPSSRSEIITETFGGSTVRFGGSSRDRGNVFYVDESCLLTEIEMYLRFITYSDISFIVYEGASLTGTYTKKLEVAKAVTFLGDGFHSSGPIEFMLEAGKYYYLGASWKDNADYFRNYDAIPVSTSFGSLKFGQGYGLAGYPPASTINMFSQSFSPYYQKITTQHGFSWLEVDKEGMDLDGNTSDVLHISVNADGLQPGSYRSDIIFDSNDPDEPQLSIPVFLEVAEQGSLADLSASASPAEVCLGDSTLLSAQLSGGNGTYIYQWESEEGQILSYEDSFYYRPDETQTLTLGVYDGSYELSEQQLIGVNGLPQVSFSFSDSLCANAQEFELYGASPTGGLYFGQAVLDNWFYPSMAWAGSHKVYYQYTDTQTGCQNMDSAYVFLRNIAADSLFFQNNQYAGSIDTAAINIFAGADVDPSAAAGNWELLPAGTALFTASGKILLKPGFHAFEGSSFKAMIGSVPCPPLDNPGREALAISGDEELSETPNDDDDFMVYPNPTTGKLFLETRNTEIDHFVLSVYNMQGSLLWEEELHSSAARHNVRLSGYNTAMYLICIKWDKGMLRKKILLQK